MYFFGCDPDLHSTAIAVVDQGGQGGPPKVVLIFVLRIPSALKDADAVIATMKEALKVVGEMRENPYTIHAGAVEGQEVAYSARMGVSPRDMIPIAAVAGGMIFTARLFCGQVYYPKPQAWKGSVPKGIHQARTYARLGIACEQHGGKEPYQVPVEMPNECEGWRNIKQGEWKHVGDAIGLALWAMDHYFEETNRAARLAAARA